MSIDEKIKRLQELIQMLPTSDRDEVVQIVNDIAKDRYESGRYASQGPKIDLYGDRKKNGNCSDH